MFLAHLHQLSIINEPFCRQCRPGLGRKSSSFQKHNQPIAMHQPLQDFWHRGWVQEWRQLAGMARTLLWIFIPSGQILHLYMWVPFEITPKASFTTTGSAQKRKQCLCMDAPGLLLGFSFRPTRNHYVHWQLRGVNGVSMQKYCLWDYYRDVCGVGRERVVLSRAGSTGKGRL